MLREPLWSRGVECVDGGTVIKVSLKNWEKDRTDWGVVSLSLCVCVCVCVCVCLAPILCVCVCLSSAVCESALINGVVRDLWACRGLTSRTLGELKKGNICSSLCHWPPFLSRTQSAHTHITNASKCTLLPARNIIVTCRESVRDLYGTG